MVPARDLRPAGPPAEAAAEEPGEVTADDDENPAEHADVEALVEVEDTTVEDTTVEDTATETDDAGPEELTVPLDIEPAADVENADERATIAPVVALFAGEIDLPVAHETDTATDAIREDESADPDATEAMDRGSVDDLFAKLRASRSATVVERTRLAGSAEVALNDLSPDEEASVDETALDLSLVELPLVDEAPAVELPDSTQELTVFQAIAGRARGVDHPRRLRVRTSATRRSRRSSSPARGS